MPPSNSRTLQIVTEIEAMLCEVARLQKDYVAKICPECADPCCKRVHYLFCEKDILFLKLSGRRARWSRQALKSRGCWFLGPGGCILDPESRPFICHRYICPDLEKEMKKDDPGLLTALHQKFRAIDEMRGQMWAEYLNETMR